MAVPEIHIGVKLFIAIREVKPDELRRLLGLCPKIGLHKFRFDAETLLVHAVLVSSALLVELLLPYFPPHKILQNSPHKNDALKIATSSRGDPAIAALIIRRLRLKDLTATNGGPPRLSTLCLENNLAAVKLIAELHGVEVFAENYRTYMPLLDVPDGRCGVEVLLFLMRNLSPSRRAARAVDNASVLTEALKGCNYENLCVILAYYPPAAALRDIARTPTSHLDVKSAWIVNFYKSDPPAAKAYLSNVLFFSTA